MEENIENTLFVRNFLRFMLLSNLAECVCTYSRSDWERQCWANNFKSN